jgi:hypothetical protein
VQVLQILSKIFRSYLPEQDLLLPPSLRDWLPEDHLAYFVSDVVDELDLSAIEAVYGQEERGQPLYRPRVLTKISLCLLRGSLILVQNAEPFSRRCGLPSVCGREPNRLPHHLRFPQAAPDGVAGVVRSDATDHTDDGADEAGVSSVGWKQGEGNASKHKAMSYARMKETEKRLRRLLE